MSMTAANRAGPVGRRSYKRGLAAGVTGLVVGLLLSAASPAEGAMHLAAAGSAKQGPYGFNSPDAAAVSGADLFVANKAGNSISELNASSGAYIRVIAGAAFKLNTPTALETISRDIFIANGRGGVTEISAGSASLVRTMSGRAYGFSDPVALASNGSTYLFVLNGAGSITRISVATGKPRGIASGKQFGFDRPTALVLAGAHLFVTNSGNNSVTEIDAGTMRWVATLSAPKYQFATPSGIAAHNGAVWVTNTTGRSVTEIAAQTGALRQVVPNTSDYLPTPGPITYGDGYFFAASPPGSSPMITQIVPRSPASMPWMMCNTNGPYLFSNPEALVVAGSDLWVVNEGSPGLAGNSLTEMNPRTGDLIRTIS